MTLVDLNQLDERPVVVQRATGLPADDDGWTTVRYGIAHKARMGLGADLGTMEIDMAWGQVDDPNDPAYGTTMPTPPLAVDDLVRIVTTLVDENGTVTVADEICVGVLEKITWQDATIATCKVTGLGALLARMYVTSGAELTADGLAIVDPGYLPAFNAIPGGDRSAGTFSDDGGDYYVHDRRVTGAQQPWGAFALADLMLKRFMRAQIAGAPTGNNFVPWRFDLLSDNANDYIPTTQDFNGKNLAEIMESLFGARRGLTWTITTADGYAQVFVVSLDATGTNLDTTADLGYSEPKIEDRRDGYDLGMITSDRPITGITVWWDPDDDTCPLEPDSWTPGTDADTALDAAVLNEIAGQSYNRPEWRRFRIRSDWDGGQYQGDGSVGLRNKFSDGTNPPNGDGRTFSPPNPPYTTATIERFIPCGAGFSADPSLPEQCPVVVAGSGTTWIDLSEACRPAPAPGGVTDRTEQRRAIIDFGDSAESADRLRQALKDGGQLLCTIGIREWAPLQAGWASPAADWSKVSPRIYHLRHAGLEERVVLVGSVKGVDSAGNLLTTAAELVQRSDVPRLQTIRNQLRVRYGNTITSISITRAGIHVDKQLASMLANLIIADGRSYEGNIPLAEITWDFTGVTTTYRWSNLLKETPVA